MKEVRKKWLTEYTPLIVTFIGIVISAIVFKQAFIKTLPVCISLFVWLLSSRADRVAFLVGAINAGIYCIGYFMEGVYGTMVSSLISMTIQAMSFFVWKKNAYKRATEFKKLNGVRRAGLGVGIIMTWLISSFVLYKMGGQEYILDGLVLTLGFVVPVMKMAALIDALPLNLLSITISLIMWVRIVFVNGAIANITYCISMIFTLYMAIRMTIKWLGLYKEQQNNKQEKI